MLRDNGNHLDLGIYMLHSAYCTNLKRIRLRWFLAGGEYTIGELTEKNFELEVAGNTTLETWQDFDRSDNKFDKQIR